MQIETIRDQLRSLNLRSAAENLESILEARKTKSEINWLSQLLEAEINVRKENAIERRIKKATFPERRTLEQFNWNFNKKIDHEKINEL